MPDREFRFSIVVDDKGTPKVTDFGQTATQTFQKVGTAAEGASSSWNKFKETAKGAFAAFVGGLIPTLGIIEAARKMSSEFKDAIKEGMRFEEGFARVIMVSKGSAEELKGIREALIHLNPNLGDTTQLAMGMYKALSAGADAKTGIDLITVASKMAQVGMISLDEAIFAITNTMKAYGLSMNNPKTSLADFTRISDTFVTVTKNANIPMNELSRGMMRLTSAAAQSGVPFEQVGAALEALKNKGVPTYTAMWGLTRILQTATEPTALMAKAMRGLGIEFDTSQAKAKGLVYFIEKFSPLAKDAKVDFSALAAAGDMENGVLEGTSQAAKSTQGALGKLYTDYTSYQIATALLTEKGKGFTDALKAQKEGAGATSKAFEITEQTMASFFKDVSRIVDKAKIEFYTALVTPFKDGVMSQAEFEAKFKAVSDKVIQFAKDFGGWLQNSVKWLADHWDMIKKIAEAYGAWWLWTTKIAKIDILKWAASLRGEVGKPITIPIFLKIAAILGAMEAGKVVGEALKEKFGGHYGFDRIAEEQAKAAEERAIRVANTAAKFSAAFGGPAMKDPLAGVVALSVNLDKMNEKLKAAPPAIVEVGKAAADAAPKMHEFDAETQAWALAAGLLDVNVFSDKIRLVMESIALAQSRGTSWVGSIGVMHAAIVETGGKLIEFSKITGYQIPEAFMAAYKEAKEWTNAIAESAARLERLKTVAKSVWDAVAELSTQMRDSGKSFSDFNKTLVSGMYDTSSKYTEKTREIMDQVAELRSSLSRGGTEKSPMQLEIEKVHEAYDRVRTAIQTELAAYETAAAEKTKLVNDFYSAEQRKMNEFVKNKTTELAVVAEVEIRKRQIEKETDVEKIRSLQAMGVSNLTIIQGQYATQISDARAAALKEVAIWVAGFGVRKAEWQKVLDEINAGEGKAVDNTVKNQKKVVAAIQDSVDRMATFDRVLTGVVDGLTAYSNALGDSNKHIKELIADIVLIINGYKNITQAIQNAAQQQIAFEADAKNAGKSWEGSLEQMASNVNIIIAAVTVYIGIVQKLEAAVKAAFEASQVDKFKQALKDLGVISDDLYKKIYEKFKTLPQAGGGEMKGSPNKPLSNMDTAKLAYINELMDETGINAGNLAKYWQMAFDVLRVGGLTAEEKMKAAGGAFTKLLANAQQFGTEGSAAMDKFIKAVQASGLQIKEVTDYINSQLGVPEKTFVNGAKGLELMANRGVKAYDELEAKILEAQDAIKRNDTTQDWDAQLKGLLAKRKDVVTGFASDLGNIERRTWAVYTAMMKNGSSYVEAINAIGPALDLIIKKRDALAKEGIITPKTAGTESLLRVRDIIAKNQDLFDAMEGNLGTLNALANTGSMTQEIFNDVQGSVGEYMKKLQGAGMTGKEALMAMVPTLQRLEFLHKEQGFAIDAETQKLIDQANEQGLMASDAMTTNDIMLEGFAALIEAVGGTLPAAFQTAMDKMHKTGAAGKDAAKEVESAFTTTAEVIPGMLDLSKEKIYDLGTVGGEAADNLNKYFTEMGKTLPDAFTPAIDKISEMATAGDSAASTISLALEGTGSTLDDLIKKGKAFTQALSDAQAPDLSMPSGGDIISGAGGGQWRVMRPTQMFQAHQGETVKIGNGREEIDSKMSDALSKVADLVSTPASINFEPIILPGPDGGYIIKVVQKSFDKGGLSVPSNAVVQGG